MNMSHADLLTALAGESLPTDRAERAGAILLGAGHRGDEAAAAAWVDFERRVAEATSNSNLLDVAREALQAFQEQCPAPRHVAEPSTNEVIAVPGPSVHDDLQEWLAAEIARLVPTEGEGHRPALGADNRPLVNELYARFCLLSQSANIGPPTFFAAVANALRNLTKERARQLQVSRNYTPAAATEETANIAFSHATTLDAAKDNPSAVLQFSKAWDDLAETNPEVYRICSLYYFADREEPEIASLLQISTAKVDVALALCEHLLGTS
jgi:hypothetical protein